MHNDSSMDVSCQQPSQAKPKIIFIASLSHSGSTLLDLMLNAHPEVVSVGEVKQLRRYAALNEGTRATSQMHVRSA